MCHLNILIFHLYSNCKFGKESCVRETFVKLYGKRSVISLIDFGKRLCICSDAILIGRHLKKVIILIVTGRNTLRSNVYFNIGCSDNLALKVAKFCSIFSCNFYSFRSFGKGLGHSFSTVYDRVNNAFLNIHDLADGCLFYGSLIRRFILPFIRHSSGADKQPHSHGYNE